MLKLDYVKGKSIRSSTPVHILNIQYTSKSNAENSSGSKMTSTRHNKGFHIPNESIFSLNTHATKSLVLDISQSVVVETIKTSYVPHVMNQLDSLCYDNILVRGLSTYKFILIFMDKEEFLKLDKYLLGLVFLQCRGVEDDDLIIPRKVFKIKRRLG